MRPLVRVLISPPPADIDDQDGRVGLRSCNNVMEQSFETVAAGSGACERLSGGSAFENKSSRGNAPDRRPTEAIMSLARRNRSSTSKAKAKRRKTCLTPIGGLWFGTLVRCRLEPALASPPKPDVSLTLPTALFIPRNPETSLFRASA